jgi:hypothetical protein
LKTPVEKTETREGGETAFERVIDIYLGNAIHLFLSLLALMIMVAATVATFDVLVRDFPKLWQQPNEYETLHQIIQSILLVAIAAELGLLLLFHRAGAAIEVVIFVIARKLVTPGLTGFELLLGVTALAGLIIVRFYYLPTQTRQRSPAGD